MKDNSSFETQDVPQLSLINQEEISPLEDITDNFFNDTEIEEMENLLEEGTTGLKKKINMRAWSLMIDTYSTREEVMKDFILLQKKGYKAYVRDYLKDGEVIYTLNVGPNINEETVRLLKKEIQDVLNVSPEVQYYRD
jgi:hypothetical protein